MEERILTLLSEEYPEIDFTASNELVDDGILDSLTITGIIATLSKNSISYIVYPLLDLIITNLL